MNIVILTGRLTRDPEVRSYNQNGDLSGRFTLAVEPSTKEGSVSFINCICFGKTAEVLEKYCVKGNKIAVTGRINCGSYADKTGEKKFTMDVICDRVEFCENKNSANGRTSNDRR